MSNTMAVEVIASKILEIRGKKVMLDRDLAKLYGVETKVLNQSVRRSIKRFPEDFMKKTRGRFYLFGVFPLCGIPLDLFYLGAGRIWDLFRILNLGFI